MKHVKRMELSIEMIGEEPEETRFLHGIEQIGREVFHAIDAVYTDMLDDPEMYMRLLMEIREFYRKDGFDEAIEEREVMPKERITTEINNLFQGDYGFDVYIAMKNDEQFIKRFVLYEGRPTGCDNFKKRIRESIVKTIHNKYLAEESQYVKADALVNEQDRMFVITQNENYAPFSYLTTADEAIQDFSLADKENADAILFKFTKYYDEQIIILWAYQKIQPSAIPNKQKKHFQLKAKSPEKPDVFEEMTDQLFIITHAVDLLVLGNEIITDNVKLLERHFGLEKFIRASAARAVDTLVTVQLVNNVEKLQAYVQRPNKKYAKKMMTIHKYPVSSMTKQELLMKLTTVERWKNVFEFQDQGIQLRNFTDVEQLIDLFTERYTKSEVTGQEYDTTVKEIAGSII